MIQLSIKKEPPESNRKALKSGQIVSYLACSIIMFCDAMNIFLTYCVERHRISAISSYVLPSIFNLSISLFRVFQIHSSAIRSISDLGSPNSFNFILYLTLSFCPTRIILGFLMPFNDTNLATDVLYLDAILDNVSPDLTV